MYQPLIPCPACRRHVRSVEASCPFCNAALPIDAEARVVPGTTRRIQRSAMFAFATIASSVAIAACSSSGSGTPAPGADSNVDAPADAVSDTGAPGVMYGPAPFDSGRDGGPDDDGAPGTKYGSPPIDSGDGG